MTKLIVVFSLVSLSFGAPWTAHARDTQHILPIAAGVEARDAVEKLSGSIKFFFGDQKYPAVLKNFGSYVSNRKTNAFGKSDEEACQWAFLSALLTFEKRAQELGANAVVNIVSYYKKNERSSATHFECHAGAIIAGVALKGDFVTLAAE